MFCGFVQVPGGAPTDQGPDTLASGHRARRLIFTILTGTQPRVFLDVSSPAVFWATQAEIVGSLVFHGSWLTPPHQAIGFLVFVFFQSSSMCLVTVIRIFNAHIFAIRSRHDGCYVPHSSVCSNLVPIS